ncbi:MAG: recombinase family protein [Butyricicoccus sp.]|nr:recombinase family protein [Butyricicoccus sp.]
MADFSGTHVVLYLRKSRADIEAEQSGAGNTLARHRHTLTELAARMELTIDAVYEEVVSGDTIAARPEMQRLLAEVEAGLWKAVLVMEVERLARGDSIDQGIVARAFRYSGTRIITPSKIYDPCNEFDEEFLEFGLFMSRREYQTIRRRLTAGVQASRREGKYTGSVPPYGYRKQKLTGEKGFTLIPDPQTAPIVQQIFSWFLTDRLSMVEISKRLNTGAIPRPNGGSWYPKTIANLLENPHYAGYTTNSRRPVKAVIRDGAIHKTRPRNTQQLVFYEGRHPALVSREQWQAAQARLQAHTAPPVPRGKGQANAFCGLLYCSVCGSRMQRGQYGKNSLRKPYLFCMRSGCPTVSSSYEAVETLVQAALQNWCLPWDPNDLPNDNPIRARSLAELKRQRDRLALQKTRAMELVETGVYSPNTFQSRIAALDTEQQQIEQKLHILLQMQEKSKEPISPPPVSALYVQLTPHEQNELLKTLIEKIVYQKSERALPGFAGDLTLTIYPRLPYPAE